MIILEFIFGAFGGEEFRGINLARLELQAKFFPENENFKMLLFRNGILTICELEIYKKRIEMISMFHNRNGKHRDRIELEKY